MTVNDLPLLAVALLIISLLLFAGMAWLQTCKGSYRVPLKLSSNGALPTKLKDTKLWMKGAVNEYPVRPPPPPAPPKKPCKDCYTCKCGER